MLFDSILLKSFVAVCDTRSFTRAATAVHLSQSAISLHVKRLEEQAGTPLIDRPAHRFALTIDGEILLSYARRILALHEEAKIELSRSRPRGIVRLGAPEYFDASILASLLGQFATLYPEVRLEVQIGLGPDVAAQFDKGQLDVAIVNRELGEGEGTVIFQDSRVWAASKAFTQDARFPLPLALFPPPCAWRRLALTRLDEVDLRWTVVLQSTGVAGLMAAVEAGLAVTVLAGSSLTSSIRPVERLPPLPDFEYVVRRVANANLAANRLTEVIVDFSKLFAALRQPPPGIQPVQSASRGDRTRRLSRSQEGAD